MKTTITKETSSLAQETTALEPSIKTTTQVNNKYVFRVS